MKLDTAPGVKITLRVDGHQLREYDDPEPSDNPLEAAKYVEAHAGKHFVIHMSVHKPHLEGSSKDRILCEYYLDGKKSCSLVHDVHEARMDPFRWSYDSNGPERMHHGRRVLEKFTFASLKTNDGPLKGLKPEEFKQLGEVMVRCTFVRARGTARSSTRGSGEHGHSKSNDKATIPEKCLKGRSISNRVSLGKPETLRGALTYIDLDYLYGKQPFATYVFKYRSRRDLQIEGIIPRSPSPVPLEDRDPDDLSPEEARELVRRMRTRDQDNAKIKQEQLKVKREKRDHAAVTEDDDDADDDDVTITDESRPHKRNRTSGDSGIEIIDLSED